MSSSFNQTAAIIAIANQKGGVAKTTTAINLGASLALAGQRVLLVDLDPQGNLTSGLGLKDQTAPAGSTYDALVTDNPRAQDFVLATTVEKLSIVPANRHLTGAEIELVSLPDRERRLARLLEDLRSDYNYIFVDSPPSLGLLTLNALVAADSVLIPLNCEYFALEGIAELTSTVERVRASLNPRLAIDGVLLTMYDDRTNLGQQVSANIREYFGDRVYDTVIPRNIRLGEAPSHGVPVLLYDPRSRGADAYVALARELLTRHGRRSSEVFEGMPAPAGTTTGEPSSAARDESAPPPDSGGDGEESTARETTEPPVDETAAPSPFAAPDGTRSADGDEALAPLEAAGATRPPVDTAVSGEAPNAPVEAAAAASAPSTAGDRATGGPARLPDPTQDPERDAE